MNNYRTLKIHTNQRDAKIPMKIEIDKSACKSLLATQCIFQNKLICLYADIRKKSTGEALDSDIKECNLLEEVIKYTDKVITANNCLEKLKN